MAEKITYSAKFKRNYVAVFAVALFFFMVISEVVLAVSIPLYMSRENLLSHQVRNREMQLRFDYIRGVCKNISSTNETVLLEKRLLMDSLDYLAQYLRQEASNLTEEEVKELDQLVIKMEKIVKKLALGKSFSQENRLDSSVYINSLIQKRTGNRQ